MKAVVVEGPNAVSYREVQAPTVGPRDVLVASREAGLCRTDIEMMTGVFTDPRWVRFPVIPGHEWAGTVVEVGTDVESSSVGDRVVCEGFVVCHRCRRCRSGETQWCERIEALGFTRPGGYAELVAVPEQVVHRLPEHVSFDAGVLVEPASVVLRGLEKADPAPGEAVGVIGVGTLGALAIALLRLHSPSRIVAFGVREEELELARALGATDVVLCGRRHAARGRARPRRRDGRRPRRGHARHAAVPAGRPGRPARDRRRGTDADPPLRSAREPGPDAHRQHRLPGVDLVARRRAARRARPRPRPDRDASVPDRDFEAAVRLMDDRRGIVAKVVLEHA
jgi:threonine dehydrogenase-like Zn-dependent dehydrogenase